MKKNLTIILLFLSIFGFSNAKTKTSNDEKQSVINSFYEFMKFHTSPENVKKNVFTNSVESTNEILGKNVGNQHKKNLEDIAASQTNKSLKNAADYLVIANSKISYKVLNAEIKNESAVLTVHIKGPNFTAHGSELENYIKKVINEDKKKISKMNNQQYQSFLLEKISEFYSQLVKRSDLKYMESDIKVYVKKYPNTWGVIQDYTLNNAIYKYLGFGYGPELIR
ncbi:hypothetical protein [Leptotrichia sp. oral taxon 223]|uniref:hypothetical protein n=1 Tax=Leptotrichia sp. oral taxon 223 TaxID=712363 RepID=UPI0015BE8748|nr:hypothetical protein [Leptotrichia sp. oral taxon 223]NWO18120.1 hypothetical protein [Leptotrichia sp. oral taxon 223]